MEGVSFAFQAPGVGQIEVLPGSGGRNVHFLPFVVEELLLLERREVLTEVRVGEVAFTQPHDEHVVPFKPLCGVYGRDRQEAVLRRDGTFLIVGQVKGSEPFPVGGKRSQVIRDAPEL